MKKLTALISTLALLTSLCACSGQAGSAESEDVSTEPVTASQAVSESPSRDIEPSEEPSAAPPEETEAPEPGGEVQPSAASETSDPAQTPAPSASAPTPTPSPEPDPASDPKTVAQGLIGRPVSELYAAIGQPIASDYVPGCVEPNSEDGELIYSGFTVYTVRTDAQEYVYDVL